MPLEYQRHRLHANLPLLSRYGAVDRAPSGINGAGTNSKSEARSSKQYQMFDEENSKQPSVLIISAIWSFEIVSDFDPP
jgi:hypothetical protein